MKNQIIFVLPALLSTVKAGPPADSDQVDPNFKKCGVSMESGIVARKGSTNLMACRNNDTGIPENGNKYFADFDVWYNGSVSLAWEGTPGCATTTAKQFGQLRIGQIQHPESSSLTRADWDNNPYYLSFETLYNKNDCNTTVANSEAGCASFFSARSSSPDWYWTQWWTLSATKTTNGFSLFGNYSTIKLNRDNDWTIYTKNCGNQKSYGGTHSHPLDEITVSGTITPDNADIVFTIGNGLVDGASGKPIGAKPLFKFTGNRLPESAQLVTVGAAPQTQGKWKYPDPEVTRQAMADKVKKIIIICVAIVLGAGLLLGLLCCLCCMRRRKQRNQHTTTTQYESAPFETINHQPYVKQ